MFCSIDAQFFFTPGISRSVKILARITLEEIIIKLKCFYIYKTLVCKGRKLQYMQDYILSDMFCLFLTLVSCSRYRYYKAVQIFLLGTGGAPKVYDFQYPFQLFQNIH